MKFGRFELLPTQRVLLADGVPVRLGARAMDVLCVLVEHGGHLVDKHELIERVWPGRDMPENNLTVQVSALRKVLGPEGVRTIAGRGYQLGFAVQAPLALPADLRDASTAAPPTLPLPPIGGLRKALPPLANARPRSPAPRDTSAFEPLLMAEAPLLLCASLAAPAGRQLPPPGAMVGLLGPLERAFQHIIESHGGQLLPPAARHRLASFYSVRDAVACCRQLHQTYQVHALGMGDAHTPAPVLRLALHRIEGPIPLAADVAARLGALCGPGQAMVSAGVAGQLIPALDGDVHDMGEKHLGIQFGAQRVYSLALDDAAQPGRLIQAVADLRPTVAVVPPAGLDHGGDSHALGDIVSDQLIAALSRSHVLNVISRLSTQALRQRGLSAQQVGRLLGAQFVVSGHCVRVAGRLRVQLEIADGLAGRVLGTCSAEDADHAALHSDSALVLSLVGDIARTVLQQELQTARTMALPSLSSHTLLLAGIGLLFRLAPSDFSLAYRALDEVRRRAPRHAAPLAWLARWHLFRLVQGGNHDRQADGRSALELAQRALDLDPDSSLALTMLATTHVSWVRDLDRAAQLCDTALSINPNESLAWLQRGNIRSFSGDGTSALACAQRAVSLSPLDPARHYYLSLMASAALTAQDYERAIQAAREALQLNHAHVSSHRVLVIAQQLSGRHDEARESARQLMLLEPHLTMARYVAQSPGARSGLADTFGRALRDAGVPPGGD